MATRIDPDTIYTRDDLAEAVSPFGINVATFLSRLRPKKVFKSGWLGSDILEAYRNAPPLGAPCELPHTQGSRPQRSSRGKRRQSDETGFTDEELGL